jgi:hypothetical protein
LAERRKRHDLLQTYKILNDNGKIDYTGLLIKINREAAITRLASGHDNLVIRQARTDIRKKLFLCEGSSEVEWAARRNKNEQKCRRVQKQAQRLQNDTGGRPLANKMRCPPDPGQPREGMDDTPNASSSERWRLIAKYGLTQVSTLKNNIIND